LLNLVRTLASDLKTLQYVDVVEWVDEAHYIELHLANFFDQCS